MVGRKRLTLDDRGDAGATLAATMSDQSSEASELAGAKFANVELKGAEGQLHSDVLEEQMEASEVEGGTFVETDLKGTTRLS